MLNPEELFADVNARLTEIKNEEAEGAESEPLEEPRFSDSDDMYEHIRQTYNETELPPLPAKEEPRNEPVVSEEAPFSLSDEEDEFADETSITPEDEVTEFEPDDQFDDEAVVDEPFDNLEAVVDDDFDDIEPFVNELDEDEEPLVDEPFDNQSVEEFVEEIESDFEPLDEPESFDEQVEDDNEVIEQPLNINHQPAGDIVRNPVDLRKMFTLNDKFLFKRELFNNSDVEFNDTLALIASMHSLDEAQEYLFEDLQWDEESAPVRDFMSVINSFFKGNA